MKSGRKKAQMKKEKSKTKINHYIPEDYSDEIVSEIKSQLQMFNRKQLEKLICVLSQEVVRLEHMLQSCSLYFLNDNGQSEHSGCQTIINGDSESKHLRTKCSVVHRLVQSVKSVSQFTTNKAGEIMEQQWRVNNEQLTKTEGCKTGLNLNNEIVGDEHENSCEHTDMQLPSHQNNVECSSYTRIHQPPMKRHIVSDDACLEDMFFSKATKFNRKKEMNNNTQILTNDKVLNSTCEENKNPLRNQKNEPVSLELEHQVPSTGNSQASSKLIPSTDNSQANSKLIPSTDNSQASSKLIPSTDNSQASSKLIPSTDNSQASSKLIPSTDNSQANSKLIPSTDNSQASSKLIPSTDNSQANSKLIPSTDNSQASSKLIPSTDNSQASFKLSNSGQRLNNEKGSAQDRADVTHYGSVPREKIQLLEKSSRYKVTKWPSVRSVLKIASEASSVKDVLKIPSETSQENGMYICFFCQVPFQSKLILIEHMKTEHNCTQYCCIVCGKSFRYKHSLKAHQRGSHSGTTVLCSYCGKLVLQARLDMHMEKVHERPNYTCHICQKGFLKRECMEGHINKHSNTKPYICEHCGRKYAYSTSLSSHRKQCARASMPPHLQQLRSLDNKSASCVCEICGLKFEGVSGLKDHLSAKHSDKVQYCSFCGKGFQWRPSYNRHIKKCVDRTDLERDRYRCLKSQKTVNRHYVCVCGKQYPYRQSFRRHERSCHQKQVESSISNSVNTASSGDVPFSENLSSGLQLSTSLNLQ